MSYQFKTLKSKEQEITIIEKVDANDNPTGGFASCNGLNVCWQDGPLVVGDIKLRPNGAFVEDLINVAINRL